MSKTPEYPEKCCMRCKYLYWAVGIGLGVRCKHPKNKNKILTNNGKKSSSASLSYHGKAISIDDSGISKPMIPRRSYCCEFFEPS